MSQMFCFLEMFVKKIEMSNFLSDIFIFCCQILQFSWLHAKTLYYYEQPCLLNISITNERIYKSFFSPENWDSYANFEYRTISLQFLGAEIFEKQNWYMKINVQSFLVRSAPPMKMWHRKLLVSLFFYNIS